MRLLRLSDDDLDFMAQTYADNRYVFDTTDRSPSQISSRVRRLLKYGFINEERKPRANSFMADFYLIRPTPRGIRYLQTYDTTEVLRALIRVDRIECATLWIYSHVKDLGALPEFISHKDPEIRTAARVRFNTLVRKQNKTLNQ